MKIISKETNMPYIPDVCIYHHPCHDGFASACIVNRRWPGRVEFIPAQYGDPAPLDRIAGRNVLIVDFSYKKPVLDSMASRARSVVVLDHHKTAREELGGYPSFTPGRLEDIGGAPGLPEGNMRAQNGNVLVHFDMEHSGAGLTWKFCCPQTPVPYGVRLVQDRDLWRWELPDSGAFHLYLQTLPMTFGEWQPVLLEGDHMAPEILQAMQAVGRYSATIIEAVVSDARLDSGELGPDHHRGCAVVWCPPVLASDVGNAVLDRFPDAPYAVVLWPSGEGVRVSLRSQDHRVDVSEIARVHGGGGHRNAAGYFAPVRAA